MPPIPRQSPKVIIYHQTHHTHAGEPVSILPLLGGDGQDGGGGGGGGEEGDGAAAAPAVAGGTKPSATHVIVAAIHVNADADHLTLNDHPPDHPRFDVLWREVAAVQAAGVRVLGLLGGAAKGTFERLDVGNPAVSGGGGAASSALVSSTFERYYAPLARLVRQRRLDGLDLDVEEPMSFPGIVHLVDRLRYDFGPRFLITLAPVAAALLRPYDPRCNLSGFSYADLEAARGTHIAWYHAQFYCGWGDAAQAPAAYAALDQLAQGGGGGGSGGSGYGRMVAPHRVVLGLVTNPGNGPGFVPLDAMADVLMQLQAMLEMPSSPSGPATAFAGVSGWEYFNSLPAGPPRPWEWAEWMSAILGTRQEDFDAVVQSRAQGQGQPPLPLPLRPLPPVAADPDVDDGPEAPVPAVFEYRSDTEDGV